MAKTLERYQKCSYGALEVHHQPAVETQRRYQEYLKLKSKVEALQKTQRNLLGEELDNLDVNELERLERQLDSSLKQIRSNKTQLLLDQLSDLQRKEEMLLETNNVLRNKLEEINMVIQPTWDAREQNATYNSDPPQSEGYYETTHCNSTLQIGRPVLVFGGFIQFQTMSIVDDVSLQQMISINLENMAHASMIELYVEFEQVPYVVGAVEEAQPDLAFDGYYSDSEKEFEGNYEMDDANEEDVLEHDMDSDVGDVANALANEFPFQEASFMRVLDE
ncbi:hypothetical protein PIB30_066664 [Stylosanthes scabra]|uniref:K-box domain-containing protein n=1 Tax=Stylosanthes scabra TaxID=79078 RepID=A0ABU6VP88_9FABA|nr:hypothetical protein [Stylosanthes scabra]